MSAFTAAVITVSDSCFRGEREDVSGPKIRFVLEFRGFQIVQCTVVPDDLERIKSSLIELSAAADLVVTTGGTGIAARDVTPEATRAVCDRLVDGIPERMRSEGVKKTPLAALSRALCGTRGQSLILNLPGSPKGAIESLEAVAELLPHMIDLLHGKTGHAADATAKS